MKILITGGFGFIGSETALALCNDHNVSIITRSKNIPILLEGVIHKIKIFNGSFDEQNLLDSILPDINLIIHTACTTVPENSTINPVHDIETNVISTIKLLESSKKHGVKKIIYLSSGGVVYGNTNEKIINELHPTNPISSYGVTKLMNEKYIQYYSILYNIDYTIFRIANAFGPNQSGKNNQGVIAHWLKKCKENEPLEIWGNENIVRDYIYIDDIVNAITTSINEKTNGIYNIGTGNGVSLIKLAETILEIIPTKSAIKTVKSNSRLFDIEYNNLDCTLFISKSSWKSKVSLKEGILKSYNR
jgi:UDP-glucose 4-epimerase